ncbi:hypothetical protein [Undibacterium sp. Di24W]|uniref:hypothetical protein n=1 Tax=Undibacterium sp. Di24W TaxID=3413033 RepID=UPI003BF30319
MDARRCVCSTVPIKIIKFMKNFQSVCRTAIFFAMMTSAIGMSWAQTSPISNDPKFAEYAKSLGAINFIGDVKAALNYCGSTFQETADMAAKSAIDLEARNQDFTVPVEAGRTAFYVFVAGNDRTSPQQVASAWEEKTLKSREKQLSQLKLSLIKDQTACLTFIKGVQSGQYDVKRIYPEIYQSIIGRTASANKR